MRKMLLLLLLAPMLCFSEIILEKENHLLLDQPFNSNSVAEIMVEALNKDLKLDEGIPLYLILYSPGGSIAAGRRLYSFLNSLGRPIHTITLFGASMGFHTAQAINGTRYILDDGTMMTHKASGGFQGEFPGQLDSRYQWILKVINKMNMGVVRRTNGKHTLQSYNILHENEYWCDGSDCIEQGFADEIAVIKCGKSLSGTKERVINGFMRSYVASFSECPLILGPVRADSADAKELSELMDYKTNRTFIMAP